MPYYQYQCKKCQKPSERVLMMCDSESPQVCDCGGDLERIYRAPKFESFNSYYDEGFKTTVISKKQEQRLMKKHGQVYTADTKAGERVRYERKRSQRKPKYIFV